MPDETVLRAKAREVIRTGKLPSRPPDHTWGGTGAGAPCPVCGETVTKDQLEFEIEFARDGDDWSFHRVQRVHLRMTLWWHRSKAA